MKICLLLILVVALTCAFWVDIAPEEADSLLSQDSLGNTRYDIVVFEWDSSQCGLSRLSVEFYFKDDSSFLRHEIGYCVPPDSTRRFYARCSEKERWSKWED